MNAVLHWFASPEWSQVVKVLLHSLWQSAVIAALLAAGMRRVVNPHWRYRLSLLALVAIPVTGIISWAALTTTTRPLPIVTTPVVTEAITPPAVLSENPQTKLVLLTNRAPTPTPVRWTAWLALVWIVGAGIMLGRVSLKLAGAERLRRSCRPLENAKVAQLLAEARLAVGLTRRIRVALTDQLTSPAVVGVLVPTLILPLSLVSTLTPDQIRFILLHELAHIRRGDYFTNLFQLFLEAVLFFNPAVWWISHQVRREREACCDALAIELSGAPADYARTLVHVAENVLNPMPDAAATFADKPEPSSLSDRVQRLLVPGYRPSLRLTWRAMIAAFILGAAMLVISAEGTRITLAQISKSSAQTVPETNASNDKPKLEAAKQSSENLRDFEPTIWPSDFDKGTLSNWERSIEKNQTNQRLSQLIPLSDAHVYSSSNNKPPFLGDLPWIGKLFVSQHASPGKADYLQLSQLSTASESNRSAYNADDNLLARSRDTVVSADLIQHTGRSGQLAANGNARNETPSGTAESSPVNPNVAANAVQTASRTNLFIRTFKVDPVTFLRGMESVVSDPAVRTNVQGIVRAFFKTLSVELSLPKSVFYNDRAGELFVRATKDELDVIESALQVVNRPTPQINIKVRFVEVEGGTDGFDAFLGDLKINNSSNTLQSFKGILTDPQYRVILQALDKRAGLSLLSEGEVTTLSGRQAQIQVVELKTIVNGLGLPVQPPPGNTSTNASTNSLYQTQLMPFGPVLDVIPTVSADGYTIQMTVIPTLTEFLGYDDSNVVFPSSTTKSNNLEILPLPRMRLRQTSTSAVVWDGQTLVLSMGSDQIITKQPDGGIKKQTNPDPRTKQVLVFITPTIIDPAGNRVNADAETLPAGHRALRK